MNSLNFKLNGQTQLIQNKDSTSYIVNNQLLNSGLNESRLKVTKLEEETSYLRGYIEGHSKTMNVLAPFLITLLLLIAGYSAYRSTNIAKRTAQVEFHDNFEAYCKRIENMTAEAQGKLAEIQEYHEAFNTIRDKSFGTILDALTIRSKNHD